MKKLFALTLAVAMVLSMASVAFAAKETHTLTVGDYEGLWMYDDHEAKLIVDDEEDLPEDGSKVVAYYGDTVYVNVWIENGTFSKEEIANNFKVKAEFSKGEKYVESVGFEKVIQKAGDDKYVRYMLAINTKDMPEAKDDADVIGTITIDPKSKNSVTGAVKAGDEVKFDVAFALNVNEHANNNEITMSDAGVMYFPENDWDEEHEIELYAGMGRFVVNTYGQGKLAVQTDVDYNEGIENADPDVNYVYFNSNNATFNRLGDLFLTANEDDVIYAVNKDGSLRKIAPEYDEDEEAFKIRTRVIGNYVIAEGELNENALVAGVEKAPEAPVAPVAPSNPSTGAAC